MLPTKCAYYKNLFWGKILYFHYSLCCFLTQLLKNKLFLFIDGSSWYSKQHKFTSFLRVLYRWETFSIMSHMSLNRKWHNAALADQISPCYSMHVETKHIDADDCISLSLLSGWLFINWKCIYATVKCGVHKCSIN